MRAPRSRSKLYRYRGLATCRTELTGRRILLFSSTAETVGPTNSLLLTLRHLTRQGCDVLVLLPNGGPFCERLREEGFPYIGLPSLTKRHLPKMVQLVQREQIDLVYANNTRGSSRLAFVAASLACVPFVCHVRSMEWDKSWMDLGYLKFADAVIAVSEACAAAVERFVASGQLHVVYNGVPISRMPSFDPEVRLQARSTIGIPDSATLLLSLSHVCERKGQTYAVEAMQRLMERVPSAHLCVAGNLKRDPAYVDRLRADVLERGVEDRVHLLGFRSDVKELFGAADMYVHTALADPHPRAVVEAMAAGLPVVAFGVDGVAETVVDHETGRLVPARDAAALAEALGDVCTSPDMGEAYGRAGRARVEAVFSDRATVTGIQSVIEGVLSGKEAKAAHARA